MSRVSQMQGVSAYLTTLKSYGKHRHPAHCIHKYGNGINRVCTNTNSPIYNQLCKSAAKRNYYKDDRDNDKGV